MPDENKTVDIDTSGPGADIYLQEEKQENDIEVIDETAENNNESNNSSEKSDEQLDVQEGTTKQEETKKDDEKLEEYSKGVQSRIAKLTRKMREAERREQAAVEYAR